MKFKFVFVFAFLFSFAPIVAAEEPYELSAADEELLDLIQEKSLEFFLKESDPGTGLVADRAHNTARGQTKAASSIAATGFALNAYPIGVERGWLDYSTAYERVRRTLHFFLNQAPHERGFFYHFMNMKTGQRASRSELSPIDTALLVAGALFAANYFEDEHLLNLAQKLYERIDWQWMLNGKDTLALAWTPETGFNKRHWDHYDESMILYLLAIGSPTYPIPAESWKKIKRPIGIYADIPVIQMSPLFTHQYSHIWVDFRDKNDGFADYFQNSINATKVNRQFCIDESKNFRTYGPNSWGLTASDGPFGYKAYGAPPGWANHDGTIAPTGCGSSIVFTPKESMACLRHFYDELGDQLWGMYGFADAFNLDKDWVAPDVIGIDVGALISMIENYRSELIWAVMENEPHIQAAMEAVGFVEGGMDIPMPSAPSYEVPYVPGGIKVDGYLKDWSNPQAIMLGMADREVGTIEDEKDLSAEVRFAWDERALYFSVKVNDQSVIVRKTGKSVWMDDALELFIDPHNDGLLWKNNKDYQLGFRAEEETGGVVAWSWFQNGEDPLEVGGARARSFVDEEGYIIEGSIKWHYIDILPEPGKEIRVSPAVHDIDRDRSEGKLSWYFRSVDGPQRFDLGKLILQNKS